MAEKILIVDDDVQTLRLISMMLERQGYRILSANTGAQALHLAHTERPNIIILDIMMPDMDGFEVTRRLRKDPETARVPILMFTAKAQVEDKISGYEAGADDYLIKPIHPAELTAHLRALLSRSRERRVPTRGDGYTIGVVAAKGGIGASTLALNLSLAFQQKTRAEVIAAELRPGQGTWSIELGYPQADGLNNLLRMRVDEISGITVENELARLPYGIRLLMASPKSRDKDLMLATEQLEAVVESLPLLARLTVLDIGTTNIPGFEMLLNHCNEIVLVTEPFPTCVQRARFLADELCGRGFGRSKLMTIISVNRVRGDVQLSMAQMQEIIGQPIAQVIPPAPEIAIQAANRNIPMILVQFGGVISTQFNSLAERVAQRVMV
jgi:DNA-binding response OmpR family regulator